jgi:dihydroneopterin aldolase
MKGKIHIQAIQLQAHIGVTAAEKAQVQNLHLDLELEYDMSKCVQSDSIKEAIDYVSVAEKCSTLFLSKEYHLLETLVFETLNMLFEAFPCTHIKARLYKRGAIPNAESTSVEMER